MKLACGLNDGSTKNRILGVIVLFGVSPRFQYVSIPHRSRWPLPEKCS
jgi:hypothetical protein